METERYICVSLFSGQAHETPPVWHNRWRNRKLMCSRFFY